MATDLQKELASSLLRLQVTLRRRERFWVSTLVLVAQLFAQRDGLDDTAQSKGSTPNDSMTLNVLLRHGVRTVSANMPATESPSVASCSTRVLPESLPSLSNSCGVVTAHTHLKTNLFQMESYKPPQVFRSSSTLQAFFLFSYQVFLRTDLCKIRAPYLR